jgi:alkylation response protein AidB-like acyl-CoA dehydrogenase
MHLRLNPDQKALLKTIRSVTQTEFKPEAARYMTGEFPWANLRRLAQLGFTGMAVPIEYGGSGMTILDTALVLEELAKGCYVTAMALLGEVGAQTRIIATYAPEPLKTRILPSVVSGDCVLAICMTEPHAGTDVASYRTNAVTKGDKVVLNGVKTLISRAAEAGVFVVFSRIDGIPGREGIGCVIVERSAGGIACTGKYQTMGGETLAEVQFVDCEVPIENLIIRKDGFRRLLTAFNTQRCLNPSISLGLAEGAFEEAIRYARGREAFGQPIAEFQGMRWKLADMYRDIEVGRSMLYRACASADPFPDPNLAAVAKLYCNDMAVRVTSEAIQVHGGYGFTDEFPVSRYFRAARYGSLGGGTSETLRDLIGKRLVDRFSDSEGFLDHSFV